MLTFYYYIINVYNPIKTLAYLTTVKFRVMGIFQIFYSDTYAQILSERTGVIRYENYYCYYIYIYIPAHFSNHNAN